MPTIIVIGGPNGAGKTTTAMTLLPALTDCEEFVNADMIARGLTPLDPDRSAIDAGRIMLERMRQLAEAGASFAVETTLASRSLSPFLRRSKKRGYDIEILYVWLSSAELARQRVAQRVREGGHSVPSDVIARRYKRGWENFLSVYMPLADGWTVCDNSGADRILIAHKRKGGPASILDERRWRAFARGAK